LSCEGAHGAVKYWVNGLPQGVTLNGSTIVIGANAVAGQHTITVTAEDELGNKAQRTISLSIVTSSSSTSVVNNGAFGGQFNDLYGGANTLQVGSVGGLIVPAATSAPSGSVPAGSGSVPAGSGSVPAGSGSVPSGPSPSDRLNGILSNFG